MSVMNVLKDIPFRQKGFSLVELSIVLGIVGLISIGAIGLYSEQHTNAKQSGSDAKISVVKKAILEYALVNKHMPCPSNTDDGFESRDSSKAGNLPAIPATPATPAIPKTATSPTIPAIPSQGAIPAVGNITLSTCTVHSGTVPYEALGLSRADAQDSYGNLFMYAVDQGAIDADLMLDCPTQTACFFNRDSLGTISVPANKIDNLRERGIPFLPAFDLSTTPLMGSLGANNLRICGDLACGNVDADGLVAVLVALNANGGATVALLSNEEQANQDGDTDFMSMGYSEDFDDQVLGIAANEIKTRSEEEAVEIVTTTSTSGPVRQSGNDLLSMGDTSVGGIGTNIGTDQAMLDSRSQTFDFGADAANKQIVLNFDSHAVGGWNQPGTTHSGVWSDRASVVANSTEVRDFRYDNTLGDEDGFEQVTFVSAITGQYSDMSTETGAWDDQYVTEGQEVTTWVEYWDESHEYIVIADENGVVDVDFNVQTTATIETIDFTNIELVFYDTPPEVPNFPSVNPISGIDETEGLN